MIAYGLKHNDLDSTMQVRAAGMPICPTPYRFVPVNLEPQTSPTPYRQINFSLFLGNESNFPPNFSE